MGTDTIVKDLPEIKSYKVGLLNLFIQHTSCALSLNENWDEDVREDMSDALDRIAPKIGREICIGIVLRDWMICLHISRVH